MALGWMTALKLVPWGDVIQATPQLVQAARKLMGKPRKGNPEPAGFVTEIDAAATDSQKVQWLQERVAQLEQGQQASGLLIESLVEQNTEVVQAIQALHQRARRLVAAVIVLAVIVLGCVGALVSR